MGRPLIHEKCNLWTHALVPTSPYFARIPLLVCFYAHLDAASRCPFSPFSTFSPLSTFSPFSPNSPNSEAPFQKSNPSLRVSHMDYGIHTVKHGDPWCLRTHRGPALNVNDLSAT